MSLPPWDQAGATANGFGGNASTFHLTMQLDAFVSLYAGQYQDRLRIPNTMAKWDRTTNDASLRRAW